MKFCGMQCSCITDLTREEISIFNSKATLHCTFRFDKKSIDWFFARKTYLQCVSNGVTSFTLTHRHVLIISANFTNNEICDWYNSVNDVTLKTLKTHYTNIHLIRTLRPWQNGCYFADDCLKCIYVNGNVSISSKISLSSSFIKVQFTIFLHWIR